MAPTAQSMTVVALRTMAPAPVVAAVVGVAVALGTTALVAVPHTMALARAAVALRSRLLLHLRRLRSHLRLLLRPLRSP